MEENKERNYNIVKDRLGFNIESKKFSWTELVMKYQLSQTRIIQIFNDNKDDICEACGTELPEPTSEDRGAGIIEQVQICGGCGATYTNR